jgi:predicted nucleic acid-binding protein
VKLFLDEPDQRTVADAIEDAGVWATSRLSYVECGAAIGRAHREGRVASRRRGEMLAQLDETWRAVTVVELDERISGAAVAIARDHPVRASDAIHLASALAMIPPGGVVTFVCYDRRLWETAGTLGVERFPSDL